MFWLQNFYPTLQYYRQKTTPSMGHLRQLLLFRTFFGGEATVFQSSKFFNMGSRRRDSFGTDVYEGIDIVQVILGIKGRYQVIINVILALWNIPLAWQMFDMPYLTPGTRFLVVVARNKFGFWFAANFSRFLVIAREVACQNFVACKKFVVCQNFVACKNFVACSKYVQRKRRCMKNFVACCKFV